mmetsp:Transcript_27216/g.59477  ORF Transcript_27216/g.59477 Transcript_27216/m.59477 type:complete len:173 (-) Transcript_27216:1280-1798(-)
MYRGKTRTRYNPSGNSYLQPHRISSPARYMPSYCGRLHWVHRAATAFCHTSTAFEKYNPDPHHTLQQSPGIESVRPVAGASGCGAACASMADSRATLAASNAVVLLATGCVVSAAAWDATSATVNTAAGAGTSTAGGAAEGVADVRLATSASLGTDTETSASILMAAIGEGE